VTILRNCWCQNTELIPFGPDYGECRACGTLVLQKSIPAEKLRVIDDDHDFYGKQYWSDHQTRDLGFPDIHARARNDLAERNLHWIRILLKYCLPPATILELGCSHGSFVALMRQAGYDAFGVEMSPWVVEYSHKTFGVPISLGPVENIERPPCSLDAIVLMDVLEHLPDPVATMAFCMKLLKPNGMMLIQTPQFREGMNHQELVGKKADFLEQLKVDEHLYLFSDRSARELFQRLGAKHIQFEPAIFGKYDMFFAVGQLPLPHIRGAEIESTLMATPNGRFVLALLDLRKREEYLKQVFEMSEIDLAARGEQIQTLTGTLKESETDRAARGEQIQTLTKMLMESEADRTARGEQIQTLTKMLKESEADRAARGEQIETLTKMLKESEADRAARWEQIVTLTKMLKD
jgi:2-polyprenyl-3-methyl-5-hydroxy-6-metoxy-1,4-benzoquinol methylase